LACYLLLQYGVKIEESTHVSLNVQARILIYDSTIPLLEEGMGKVVGIDSTTVWLKDVTFSLQDLPKGPFIIGLIITEGPLNGLAMTCSLQDSGYDKKTRPSRYSIGTSGQTPWKLRIDKIGVTHQQRLNYFLQDYLTSNKYEGLNLNPIIKMIER